jgi:hypothetical protein
MQTSIHSSVEGASTMPNPDFNVPALIDHLCNFSDAYFDAAFTHLSVEEAEALAALLIHQLMRSLSGKLLAAYLHALRSGETLDVPPVKICVRHPMRVLPVDFPEEAPLPVFLYGDGVRWTTDTTTTGHRHRSLLCLCPPPGHLDLEIPGLAEGIHRAGVSRLRLGR